MLDIDWTSSAHKKTFIWWTARRKCYYYCDQLEIFELIISDEIVDDIGAYSNLYANQSIGNKELKKT